MRILIVGYGSMGHEVEKIISSTNHTVSGRIDASGTGDAQEVTAEWLEQSDGVIEFTLGESVVENIRKYASAGIPAVIGTTGWQNRLKEVSSIISTNNAALLHGSNFSIGAHIFFRLSEIAAELTDAFSEYDLMLHEYHHKNKKDSPSGTALTAGERILKASTRKDRIVTESLSRKIEANELHISSTRGGSIPGTHTFTMDSDADSIVVQHTARSRSGFALGAVRGLEWLSGKTGIYTAEDFMQDILGGKL